jgi:hypothetical protein
MILWKYLLLQSEGSHDNNEQGFTIPLVLGFGLFMLLTGIAAIKFASTSEVNSKVQEKNLQAIAAAEIGLARIQSLVNQNRTIAVYDDCVVRNSDGSCADTTAASWANASAIVLPEEQATSCSASGTDGINQIVSIASNTAQWQEADPSNPENGQYRLIKYDYTSLSNPGSQDIPGTAELTIEGRTNQLESGATDNSSDVYNTGRARLTVEIPVTLSTKSFLQTIPGLWMQFDEFATMGEGSTSSKNQKVKGSILIEDVDCVGGGEIPTNLGDHNIVQEGGSPTGEVTASPVKMPDTPALPPDNKLNTAQSYEIFDKDNSLPRVGDIEYNGAYHYLVPNLDAAGGSGVTISDSKKVILYVQGNIELNGSLNDKIEPQNLQIYGNTVESPGYKSSGYKYGCDDVVKKNGKSEPNVCPTTSIHLGGTADLNAFVHAPEAWACLNGGGSDASVTGALWIKQWTAEERTGSPFGGGSPCTFKDSNIIDFTSVNFPPDSVLGAEQEITITSPNTAITTKWERVSID